MSGILIGLCRLAIAPGSLICHSYRWLPRPVASLSAVPRSYLPVPSRCLAATALSTCSKSSGSGSALGLVSLPKHAFDFSLRANANISSSRHLLIPSITILSCHVGHLMVPRGNYEQSFSLAVTSKLQGTRLDRFCSQPCAHI
jgi:hypothetical protein